MQIVRLQIKNFLGISDVDIKPGQVTQVVGGNNQGKTTVIRALEFAIKGSTDGSVVKFGEESAEVVVELSDATTIRRRITGSGKQSVSVTKDGFKAPSPQAMLDSLFDHAAFNPLELLDPKRRTDAILSSIDLRLDAASLAAESGIPVDQLPPLDYTQHGLRVLDQAHRYYYQRRAEANRDAAEKRKRWETYLADLPKDGAAPVGTREQLGETIAATERTIAAVEEKVAQIRRTHEDARRAQEKVNRYSAALGDLDGEIARAEAALSTLRARRVDGQKFVDDAKADVPLVLEGDRTHLDMIAQLRVEVETHRGTLKDHDRLDAVAQQRAMVASMEEEFTRAQATADLLTDKVNELAGPVKARVMERAEMPVDGLEYRDGTFVVGGVPVDNLSSSAAIRLAVGVARKLARKTKLICIDGAEALDDSTYADFRQAVEGDGYTYFITRVGEAFNDPRDRVVEMQKGVAV